MSGRPAGRGGCHAPEQGQWLNLLAAVPVGARWLFELGYPNFSRFAQLTAARVPWITRAQKTLAYTVERGLGHSAPLCERGVSLGQGEDRPTGRLIELYLRGPGPRYLTHELTPVRLPAAYAVAWYRQRGRIEDAFWIVKRRWGLAYLGGGAQHTVELALGATWLL